MDKTYDFSRYFNWKPCVCICVCVLYFFLNFKSEGSKMSIGPAFLMKSCYKAYLAQVSTSKKKNKTTTTLTSSNSAAVARDFTSTHRQTAR